MLQAPCKIEISNHKKRVYENLKSVKSCSNSSSRPWKAKIRRMGDYLLSEKRDSK